MSKLNFKRIFAKNFICFGSEGVEINVSNYGNIILIRGENLDVTPTQKDEKISTNGIGKCFGENTPILMYDGTVKMVQDVCSGDLVMGNDSTPRRVSNATRGEEMLYRVSPKKGDSYIVNESHILSLKSSDKKNGRPFDIPSQNGIYNISVKDYLSLNKSAKYLLKGWRAGVEFQRKKVRIDPYILGVWLGDGSSHGTGVTTADQSIVKSLCSFAKERDLKIVARQKKQGNKASTYWIVSDIRETGIFGRDLFLAYQLRKQGLKFQQIRVEVAAQSLIYTSDNLPSLITVNRWVKKAKTWVESGREIPQYEKQLRNSTSRSEVNSFLSDLRSYDLICNKHIPYDYKANDRATRLSLLAGLIDSDGSRCSGGYDFINKNQRLAKDVEFLARSLGLAAYTKRAWKVCKNNGKGNWYWRVTISGDCSIIPVRLKRKQSRLRKINKDPLIVGIKVEPVGKGNYYGFSVDGNHLFLLGDFTVVHNSSIIDVLTYGLYGKCVKHPKKIKADDVINNKVGKKLLVEIEWDEYKVIRARKPNKLELWEGSKNLTQGHDETQELIEEKLGISFETFANLLVFTDNNRDAFLELDTAGKRQIAENLLSLEEFKIYAETANLSKKSINNNVKIRSAEYSRLLIERDSCVARIDKIKQQEVDWKANKKKEIERIISQVKLKREELENSDLGAALSKYNESQEQITALQQIVPDREKKLVSVKTLMETARTGLDLLREEKHTIAMRMQEIQLSIQEVKNDSIKHQKVVTSVESQQEGAKCPTCYGPIKKEHFKTVLLLSKNILDANVGKLDNLYKKLTISKKDQTEKTEKIDKITANINQAEIVRTQQESTLDNIRKEINKLSAIEKPDAGAKEKILEQQLLSLTEQAGKLKTEYTSASPYVGLFQSAEEEFEGKGRECEDKKKEVALIEALLPYYEFWERGFGTKGIPMFAINGIVPTLNTQIAYWLQFLIEGTINLKFNGELEETIERNPSDGDPYIYHIMSGGERRRLNLSVAAAFSKVQAITSGVVPNVLFLDEVTTNVDAQGVMGIYRMITELARDRKVFVTTHDQNLLDLLTGCDVIFLQKKNGSTILK